jgi:HAD superfamily hydrolase (TIGR01509 family)
MRKMEVCCDMDAIIFDFDGVIVDSEPLHLAGFQEVLAREGIELDADTYTENYLGYNDEDAFWAICRDAGRALTPALLEKLIDDKAELVAGMFQKGLAEADGAVELIRSAAEEKIPLGICSGALRGEVRQGLEQLGIGPYFSAIVAAEDVAAGKPEPDGYLEALERLSKAAGGKLRASATLVIEDAPWGILAGKQAGMRVLAVATSYPIHRLGEADTVVPSLSEITLERLKELV